ncbi:hypothetical protein [Stenotrophomonas maltophilia]|uniref:hypothetical protein n=1 Tax=Stenotrophomonas maltophilia TaxID=40324 RepID=UPI003BA3D782
MAMDGQKEAFRQAHAELEQCWTGGRSGAQRWAVYDQIHDRLVTQWPADANRIVGMMVMWVTEIRGSCPSPCPATGPAGKSTTLRLRPCRIDS